MLLLVPLLVPHTHTTFNKRVMCNFSEEIENIKNNLKIKITAI